MEPKLKTELVRVEYWDCGNPDHRHKTKSVAQACMVKSEKRTALNAGPMKWTTEAYESLLKEHRSGARLCDLSKSLGLSSERVRQVIIKAKRLEQEAASPNPLETLSVRTRNCLQAENLRTIEAVRSAVEDGRIDDVPNLGAVSKEEIRRWLDRFHSK